MRVWECKIVVDDDELPDGFDLPPRRAAIAAVERAGFPVRACFSGWAGSLTVTEKRVMEDFGAATDGVVVIGDA
jgi:hypothetical protein